MPESSFECSAPHSASSASSRVSIWHGDSVVARSVRFTLAVMGPIVAGMLVGAGPWIAYALLTCILGFMLDTGGSALQRLGAIAAAGALVLAGGGLGTLVSASVALTALAFAGTAALYGLTDGMHPSAATATRFMCLTTAIGALYTPLLMEDATAVIGFGLFVWLGSVAWDAAVGMWRPDNAPRLQESLSSIKAAPAGRWVFAVIVGVAAAAAFLTARALGLEHPNWTILAIVVALRADAKLSRRLVMNLLLGTLLGASLGYAYETLFASPTTLMACMALAALLRWPAQQLHGALGLAAMAAFVVLLLQLVAHITGVASHAALDRAVDVALGCGFAAAAIWINERAQALMR